MDQWLRCTADIIIKVCLFILAKITGHYISNKIFEYPSRYNQIININEECTYYINYSDKSPFRMNYAIACGCTCTSSTSNCLFRLNDRMPQKNTDYNVNQNKRSSSVTVSQIREFPNISQSYRSTGRYHNITESRETFCFFVITHI